jgi:hypothetical protein
MIYLDESERVISATIYGIFATIYSILKIRKDGVNFVQAKLYVV